MAGLSLPHARTTKELVPVVIPGDGGGVSESLLADLTGNVNQPPLGTFQKTSQAEGAEAVGRELP